MKSTNSLKSLKKRAGPRAYIVKRGKKTYLIDPDNPKNNARQG